MLPHLTEGEAEASWEKELFEFTQQEVERGVLIPGH